MPSRDAAARRPHRRLGRALLLAAGAGAAAGSGPAAALHVVRRVRGAAGEARRPRPQARRRVPRPRRREPARRPRGGRAKRRRLLRQEHAPDHAAPRLLGRARNARHRRRARADAAVSTSTVASAGSASTPARRVRSTSRARSTRPAASATGRRRPRLLPRRIAPSSGRRSTAATSARTSARGIAASRSGAAGEPLPEDATPHVSLVDWLRSEPDELRRRFARLYVPRNDGRRLQLNALVAAGNVGGDGERDAVTAFLDDPDESMRELAAWALARLEERDA